MEPYPYEAEEALKDVENSLRDFIELILRAKHGAGWISCLKISANRIQAWESRLEVERKRLAGEALDTRILYYSDFYDLRTIIAKNWDDGFHEAFKDKRRLEVFLEELEKLRDPNAHSRALREHQKCLIVGIASEIRIQIMKYRGKKENPNDYFPVIESVSDSLGNGASNTSYAQQIPAKQVVRVGDSVEIRVNSTDPLGGRLEYSIARIRADKNWRASNVALLKFTDADIGRCCDINVMIRSERSYHAYSDFDDYVMFRYNVLPSDN